MKNFSFLLVCLVLGVSTAVPSARAQTTTASGTVQGRKLPLKEQLMLGLKARTREDRAFIEYVVARVNQGSLPRKLVESTFLWARERAEKKSPSASLRPMVYFRPGLVARARKLGIRV